MAGNKEVIDFPTVAAAENGFIYLVKDGLNYKTAIGGNGGVAPLNASGLVDSARITNLAASKITSGTFANARIAAGNVTQHQASLSIGWGQLTGIPTTFTPSAHTHAAADITSGTLADALIPSLNASKITAGTFDTARIPALPASQITSGTFAVARGGTGIASYTIGNYIRAATSTTLEQRTPTQVRSDIAAAPLASPAFTGTPTAPTATSGTNTTQLATTAFVQTAVSSVGGGTVTSVNIGNATGISFTGGPITSSGTFTPALSTNLQAWSGVTTASKANSTITVTGVTGLTGGGDLTANRTITLDTTNSRNVDHAAVSVTAGNGLTGGGTIAATRTLTLGTPGTLTGSTTNSVTASSHTHALSANLQAWDGQTVSAPSLGNVTATSINATNIKGRLYATTQNASVTINDAVSPRYNNQVVEKTNTTAYTYTVVNSGVDVQGDVITVVNSGTAGNITIARGAGVAIYKDGVNADVTVEPLTLVNLYYTGTANRWLAV